VPLQILSVSSEKLENLTTAEQYIFSNKMYCGFKVSQFTVHAFLSCYISKWSIFKLPRLSHG